MYAYLNRFLISISILLVHLMAVNSQGQMVSLPEFEPIAPLLQAEIERMDSVFFEAYNTCNLVAQSKIYSDSLEFFHDKTGLCSSKEKVLVDTEKYVCGKVYRELVEGSIEVYPIANYGAVEIGYHAFFNKQDSDKPALPSKFIIVWRKINSDWYITKVISLHS